VGVGLLVDHVEVATQLGDELLSGTVTLFENCCGVVVWELWWWVSFGLLVFQAQRRVR
jgi:hypothetical protein